MQGNYPTLCIISPAYAKFLTGVESFPSSFRSFSIFSVLGPLLGGLRGHMCWVLNLDHAGQELAPHCAFGLSGSFTVV